MAQVSSQRRTRGVRRFTSDAQRKAVMASIVQQHQGLVRREAYRTARHYPSVDKDDLIQAGNIGLIQFARRHDPSRSAFSTGATQAIRSKIQREVQKGKLVRVSEKKVGVLARKGPLPSTVGLTEASERSTSGGIEHAEARADVSRLLKSLPARDRRIVQLRFLEDRPVSEVARKLRISGPQVKKIEKRALKRMKG